MEPTQFIFIVLPLAIIIAILVVVVFYLSKRTEETDYEKEIKELRRSFLKGKIDQNNFLYIRENLKRENLFCEESKKLDDMLEHNQMDPDTYVRMKKALEMSFDEKLVKIHKKYNI